MWNLYAKRVGQTDEEKKALKLINIFASQFIPELNGDPRDLKSFRSFIDLCSTMKVEMGEMIVEELAVGADRDEALLALDLQDHKLLYHLSPDHPKHPDNLHKSEKLRFQKKQKNLEDRVAGNKKKVADDDEDADPAEDEYQQ